MDEQYYNRVIPVKLKELSVEQLECIDAMVNTYLNVNELSRNSLKLADSVQRVFEKLEKEIKRS
jgi:hypothetical protein